MYQGETITTTIIGFPVPVSEIKSLYIVFKNKFRVLLEKTLDDCTILEDGVQFRLSQAESLLIGLLLGLRKMVPDSRAVRLPLYARRQ